MEGDSTSGSANTSAVQLPSPSPRTKSASRLAFNSRDPNVSAPWESPAGLPTPPAALPPTAPHPPPPAAQQPDTSSSTSQGTSALQQSIMHLSHGETRPAVTGPRRNSAQASRLPPLLSPPAPRSQSVLLQRPLQWGSAPSSPLGGAAPQRAKARHTTCGMDPAFLTTAAYVERPGVGVVYDWEGQHQNNLKITQDRIDAVRIQHIEAAAQIARRSAVVNEAAFKKWLVLKAGENGDRGVYMKRILSAKPPPQLILEGADSPANRGKEQSWFGNFAAMPAGGNGRWADRASRAAAALSYPQGVGHVQSPPSSGRSSPSGSPSSGAQRRRAAAAAGWVA